MTTTHNQNIDKTTVDSFGDEWSHYDQTDMKSEEALKIFNGYFGIFPWSKLPDNATGFDMGVGSGRWAKLVALKVNKLNCIDASEKALNIAKNNLADDMNVSFYHGTANQKMLEDNSQDFGYSLGVLHHIPDTQLALQGCVDMLKPGAPFLLYLYYRFDNRPLWFKLLWRLSEIPRFIISACPNKIKPILTDILALTVYWPLARGSKVLEKLGLKVDAIPLSFYRNSSFYTMRTDSRDRFGTPLEQRFTRDEIKTMMENTGLENISFSDEEPYWVSLGYKKASKI